VKDWVVTRNVQIASDQAAQEDAAPATAPSHLSPNPSHLSPNPSHLTPLLLALYVAGLCVRGLLAGGSRGPSVWELQESGRLWGWLGELVWRGVVEGLCFVPVGFLVGYVVGARRVSERRGYVAASVPDADSGFGESGSRCARRAGPLSLAVGMVATFGLAVLVHAVRAGGLPPWTALVLPTLGGGLGLWIGWMWGRGNGARRRLAWQLAMLGAATVAAGLALDRWALDDQPLPFTAMPVTPAGKRQVVAAIRAGEARDGTARRWRLTEDEVNFLLAWGLSLGSPDRKARATLDEQRIVLQASLGVPAGPRRRYLNLRLVGWCEVTEGRPRVTVEELCVGRIPVPRLVVRVVESQLRGMLNEDPDVGPLVASLRQARLVAGGVEVTAAQGDFTSRVVPSLLGRLNNQADVRNETREYLWRLVSVAPSLPEGDARFLALLQSAFRLAQQRSQQGEAVRENAAAVYALAILLGHWRVEQLVGPVTDRDLRYWARRNVGPVTVRGRHDWTRHYWVSAALAVVSSEAASDAAGLLKEELDADGGSGFSFADLLADRAGTLFGLAATRDEASARRVQEWLSGGVTLDDVFPPAADLPEGLSDDQLQREYGGVGGARYREVLEEIERRCQGLGVRD